MSLQCHSYYHYKSVPWICLCFCLKTQGGPRGCVTTEWNVWFMPSVRRKQAYHSTILGFFFLFLHSKRMVRTESHKLLVSHATALFEDYLKSSALYSKKATNWKRQQSEPVLICHDSEHILLVNYSKEKNNCLPSACSKMWLMVWKLEPITVVM